MTNDKLLRRIVALEKRSKSDTGIFEKLLILIECDHKSIELLKQQVRLLKMKMKGGKS